MKQGPKRHKKNVVFFLYLWESVVPCSEEENVVLIVNKLLLWNPETSSGLDENRRTVTHASPGLWGHVLIYCPLLLSNDGLTVLLLTMYDTVALRCSNIEKEEKKKRKSLMILTSR